MIIDEEKEIKDYEDRLRGMIVNVASNISQPHILFSLSQKILCEELKKFPTKKRKNKKSKVINNEYREYLKTEHWRNFKNRIISENSKCELCNETENLVVHHKHYHTLGHETKKDVAILCGNCHYKTHFRKN